MNYHRSTSGIQKTASMATIVLCLLGCNSRDVVTEVPEPTITYTSQQSTTSAITPTSTATPTTTNTLSPQEADNLVLGLLSTNGDCSLPCVWGITPGQSNREEVLDQFTGFEDWISFPGGTDTILLQYANQGGILGRGGRAILMLAAVTSPPSNLNPDYFQTLAPDVINFISFDLYLRDYGEDPSQIRQELFSSALQYSLSNVLTTYGVPSRVLLHPLIANERAWYSYDLILVYEESGFVIYYRGPSILPHSDGTLEHCFIHDDLELIQILSRSPEDGLDFSRDFTDFLIVLDLEELVRERILLEVEDAVGITANEFHEIFQNPTDTCLFSQYEAWKH